MCFVAKFGKRGGGKREGGSNQSVGRWGRTCDFLFEVGKRGGEISTRALRSEERLEGKKKRKRKGRGEKERWVRRFS